MEISEAIKPFRNTSIYDELLTIWNYYESIENDFTVFERRFGISCPESCGRCCQRFIPDVTYLEALIMAFNLAMVRKEDLSYLQGWHGSHECCPLFNEETKRCRAYEVRPVVCRVFCSAASETKHGIAFRGCHLTTEPEKMAGEIRESELLSAGIRIPVMSEYGERVRQLQEWNTETELLDDAILAAASKLELLKRVLQESGDDFTPQAG